MGKIAMRMSGKFDRMSQLRGIVVTGGGLARRRHVLGPTNECLGRLWTQKALGLCSQWVVHGIVGWCNSDYTSCLILVISEARPELGLHLTCVVVFLWHCGKTLSV